MGFVALSNCVVLRHKCPSLIGNCSVHVINYSCFHNVSKKLERIKVIFSAQPKVVVNARRHNRTPLLCLSEEDSHNTTNTLSAFQIYSNLMNQATLLYPLWTLAASVIALWRPSLFGGMSSKSISWALSVLMFSVGSTISPKDFVPVFKSPLPVLLGFIGCYGLMPWLSLLISRVYGFSNEYHAGMILLGCVSGGQASNLSTYIANGDVALSVAMTTVSTLAAVVVLPTLSKFLLGTVIPVSPLELSKSTAEVVLIPIFLGMALNTYASRVMHLLKPVLPLIGVFATVFCVVGALSKVSTLVLSSMSQLLWPVILLHFIGGLVGYFIPKWLGMNEKVSRTLSIETCFKSPALSYVLAIKHFSSYGVRIPSAVSILVLAPVAALYSVILRFLSRKDK